MAAAAEVDLGTGAVTAILSDDLAAGGGEAAGGAPTWGTPPRPPSWTVTTASGGVFGLRPLAPPHYAALAGVQAALEAGVQAALEAAVPGLAPLGTATAAAAAAARVAAARARRCLKGGGAAISTPPPASPLVPPPLPGMLPTTPAWPVGLPGGAVAVASAVPPPILDGDTLAVLLSIPQAHRGAILAGARPPSSAVPSGSARAVGAVEAACPLAASAAVAAALWSLVVVVIIFCFSIHFTPRSTSSAVGSQPSSTPITNPHVTSSIKPARLNGETAGSARAAAASDGVA